MIEVRELGFSYGGDRSWALEGLSFSVAPGRVLGLLGPNGSGKSTLSLLLSGFFKPDRGQIIVNGLKSPGSEKQIRRQTLLIPQNIDHWLLGATVAEDLSLGFDLRNREIPAALEELAEAFGLKDLFDRAVSDLSTGQKKRLGLASALARHPQVLCLDEPLAALDWPGARIMLGKLFDLKRQGQTMVVITHDPQILADLVDHWLILGRGRAVMQGTWNQIRPHLADCGVRPPLGMADWGGLCGNGGSN